MVRERQHVLRVGFAGGDVGAWRVLGLRTLAGAPLEPVARLDVREGVTSPAPARWELVGVTSHVRYVDRSEVTVLRSVQAGLGRPEATLAALIPIRKSNAWWDLAQDERRAIFEERSHHVAATLRYLPAIARRLHHARELGGDFDFLTWFEWAPEHDGLFDELVGTLRATEEWRYVEREVDVRLERG